MRRWQVDKHMTWLLQGTGRGAIAEWGRGEHTPPSTIQEANGDACQTMSRQKGLVRFTQEEALSTLPQPFAPHFGKLRILYCTMAILLLHKGVQTGDMLFFLSTWKPDTRINMAMDLDSKLILPSNICSALIEFSISIDSSSQKVQGNIDHAFLPIYMQGSSIAPLMLATETDISNRT